MPGENGIRLEGVVVEVLQETLFRVELANGHQLLGYASRVGRHEATGLRVGFKVNLEMSPFDFSKGRIVLEQKQK